jgi:hypothetical protein
MREEIDRLAVELERSLSRKLWAMLLAALCFCAAAVLAVGCGADTAQRQTCYAQADSVAWLEAEQRCNLASGVAWEDCPERQAILAELRAAYSRCP